MAKVPALAFEAAPEQSRFTNSLEGKKFLRSSRDREAAPPHPESGRRSDAQV